MNINSKQFLHQYVCKGVIRIRRIQKTVTKEYPIHRKPGWSRLTCSYTDPMGSDQDVHIIYKLWQICIIPCRKRSSQELHGAIKKKRIAWRQVKGKSPVITQKDSYGQREDSSWFSEVVQPTDHFCPAGNDSWDKLTVWADSLAIIPVQ